MLRFRRSRLFGVPDPCINAPQDLLVAKNQGMVCNEGVQKEDVKMTMAQRDILEFGASSVACMNGKGVPAVLLARLFVRFFDGAHQGILNIHLV